jgi:hypothetical protein
LRVDDEMIDDELMMMMDMEDKMDNTMDMVMSNKPSIIRTKNETRNTLCISRGRRRS